MNPAVLTAGLCAQIALMNLWPSAGTTRGLRLLWPVPAAPRTDAATGWAALLAGSVAWMAIGPGPAAAVVSLMVAVMVTWWLPRLEQPQDRRREHHLRAQFPEAVDLLRYGLDAGLPLRTVVARVADLLPAPSCELLGRVVGHVATGHSDAQAWRAVSDDPVWGDVARDLARGVESGAAMSRLLAVTGDQARRDNAAELQRRARSVGVHSVLPLVVCYLPAFLLVGVVPIIASTLDGLGW